MKEIKLCGKKKGVSGKSLQFDGYKTAVKIPAKIAPKPTTEITLEGWIAIGAYPWNWCPIIQQADDVPETVRLFRGDYDITEIEKREETYLLDLLEVIPKIKREELMLNRKLTLMKSNLLSNTRRSETLVTF